VKTIVLMQVFGVRVKVCPCSVIWTHLYKYILCILGRREYCRPFEEKLYFWRHRHETKREKEQWQSLWPGKGKRIISGV